MPMCENTGPSPCPNPLHQTRSAQRYLEDLTPGGSEYFDNPKRCYEWVMGRIESAHRIALEAALERNRLQEENERLREQIRIATDVLEAISACDKASGGERYPGACATAAHDALIQMSVVD